MREMWFVFLVTLITAALSGFGLVAFGPRHLPAVRVFYWLISGALMGLGLISFGLGFAPYLFGAVLALYGIYKIGSGSLWLTLVSMGMIPILILVYNYLASIGQPTTQFPDDYFLGVAPFAAIAFAGIVWGLLETQRSLKDRS